jgi:AraC-like DNA-binding protein
MKLDEQIHLAIDEAIEEGEVVTVDLIAERLRVDRFTLARTIRRKGTTISEIVRWRRLHHARELLVNTSEPPKAIAFRCGYGSYATFSRHFREMFGCTASEYRQQKRGYSLSVGEGK